MTTRLDRKTMEASIRFMAEIWKNNSKEWLDMNRDRYQAHLREPLKELAETLRGPIGSLYGDFDGKPKISRINNDIRFSRGKPLYKQHMWISFGTGNAELFAVVCGSGWTACVTTGSQKREELDGWRRNLIDHNDLWGRWAKSSGFPQRIAVSVEGNYKRLLYDDSPSEIEELIQAKRLYIYPHYVKRLPSEPFGWLVDEMAALAPVYLMMTVPSAGLAQAIEELVSVPPLGPKSAAVFEALGG
jgi:hypothetical protein